MKWWVALAFIGAMVPMHAAAQGVSAARFGQRYLTLGFVGQPGVIVGEDAPRIPGQKSYAVTYETALKVALHHMFSPSVAMSAEFDAGWQWADVHAAHPEGVSAGQEHALGWQVGLMGRWFPSQDLSGLGLGGGLHWHRAGFEAASVQGMYVEGRLGWTLWRGEREPQFGMVEVGASVPLIQGLSLPDFGEPEEGGEPKAVGQWRWWRGVVSMQVSF